MKYFTNNFKIEPFNSSSRFFPYFSFFKVNLYFLTNNQQFFPKLQNYLVFLFLF
ncbi:hypothetical protein GCWU000323_00874 [Leptotrichia hofstadii F0254]|uniref:Uncharacterized protein n=1 Tax=Leptotrichia hofstadii F0254 TaxID=634994 RepID=C9MWF4_9FUSO|nr:hypothetical protein GCWU000323_00874 [Leptotrichia hofstadii F0254]